MKKYLKKSNDIFKEIANVFLEFIYPDNISCIICDRPINKANTYSMCKNCFSELNFILDGCFKCGKPIINHSLEKQHINTCSYCFRKSYYFDRAISCIEYTDFSKKIIFRLKYNNKTYISRYVANIMKEKIDIENIDFDYIMFVPLHKKRLRKRGFNQTQKIAKYLGKLFNIPVLDIIIRKEYTRRLYSLSRKERKVELKNAFRLKESEFNLKNKNILLIDDIFTTGATANEISKLIKLNGVNKIFIISFLTRANDSYATE